MKIILFGTGRECKRWFKFLREFGEEIEIVGFSDNDEKYHGTTYEDTSLLIYDPKEIMKLEADYVVITSKIYYAEIQQQLIDLGVQSSRIKLLDTKLIENVVISTLESKYEDEKDNNIHRMINAFKRDGISIFGDFISNENDYSKVFYDEQDNPYILYYGKRMYYPNDYSFYEKDGEKFIVNVEAEQREGSPHTYIQHEQDIKEDGILVDAGVCEGNFALKYVDRVKKVYLIECNPRWMKVLKHTFEPYKEKVVFVDKFLGRWDSSSQITLDSLITEEIDFLKMDIEGAEIDALLGGKNVLRRSNANMAICSYHRLNDEENIRFILENLGYETSVSNGYMFFLHDKDFGETLDFRRGIVYGKKNRRDNCK